MSKASDANYTTESIHQSSPFEKASWDAKEHNGMFQGDHHKNKRLFCQKNKQPCFSRMILLSKIKEILRNFKEFSSKNLRNERKFKQNKRQKI